LASRQSSRFDRVHRSVLTGREPHLPSKISLSPTSFVWLAPQFPFLVLLLIDIPNKEM
jgi:hypothetical protein